MDLASIPRAVGLLLILEQETLSRVRLLLRERVDIWLRLT
jgi:hypothetical protein